MDLAEHNQLSDAEAAELFTTVCSSPQWVQEMTSSRPYASLPDLLGHSDRAVEQLTETDLDAALAGHPRIGASPADASGEQSRREQSGVDSADAALANALADGNRAYEERFGRIYLVCASGRSGRELLSILQQRLGNDPAAEIAVTRGELGKINRLRLERMVTA